MIMISIMTLVSCVLCTKTHNNPKSWLYNVPNLKIQRLLPRHKDVQVIFKIELNLVPVCWPMLIAYNASGLPAFEPGIQLQCHAQTQRNLRIFFIKVIE